MENLAGRVLFNKMVDVEDLGNDDWTLTAYCSCELCCDKEDGRTASGHVLTDKDDGKVCAAPSCFEFGTVLTISGLGKVRVEDRGGDIKGKRLDIYKKSHADALAFGKRTGHRVTW